MTQEALVSELPQFHDESGNLCFMQVRDHIPFDIDRVYWISGDVPARHSSDDSTASGEVVIVALAGRLDVAVHDGTDERIVSLDRPDRSLYVPSTYTWRLRDRSSGTLALVVASVLSDTPGSRDGADHVESGRHIGGRASSVDDCAIVELPLAETGLGNGTLVRSDDDPGFPIRRVYYLTNIPKGASRGGHAHRELHQFIVAASGSFEILLDDGRKTRSITLTRPDRALHLVPGIWRDLQEFSRGSICLVTASSRYDEQDYFREYDEFRSFKGR